VLEINENDFKTIDAEKAVVVKFFVSWCGDCKRSYDFEDELENKYKESYSFYKINADNNSSFSKGLDVRGYPSYLIFKKGENTAFLHSKWAKAFNEVCNFLDKNLEQPYSMR
jgi:thiol-disulfide isomerase/thioredoxin